MTISPLSSVLPTQSRTMPRASRVGREIYSLDRTSAQTPYARELARTILGVENLNAQSIFRDPVQVPAVKPAPKVKPKPKPEPKAPVAYQGSVHSIFSPDQRGTLCQMMSLSDQSLARIDGKNLLIRDRKTGAEKPVKYEDDFECYDEEGTNPNAVAFCNRKGDEFVVGSMTGIVDRWRVNEDGEFERIFSAELPDEHDQHFGSTSIVKRVICLANRGERTFAGLLNGKIYVMGKEGGVDQILEPFKERDDLDASPVISLTVSPNGKFLAAAFMVSKPGDRHARYQTLLFRKKDDGKYELMPNAVKNALRKERPDLRTIAFSPCGRFLAAADGKGRGKVYVFQLDMPRVELRSVHETGSPATRLMWREDRIITTHSCGKIAVTQIDYETRKMKTLCETRPIPDRIVHAVLSAPNKNGDAELITTVPEQHRICSSRVSFPVAKMELSERLMPGIR